MLRRGALLSLSALAALALAEPAAPAPRAEVSVDADVDAGDLAEVDADADVDLLEPTRLLCVDASVSVRIGKFAQLGVDLDLAIPPPTETSYPEDPDEDYPPERPPPGGGYPEK